MVGATSLPLISVTISTLQPTYRAQQCLSAADEPHSGGAYVRSTVGADGAWVFTQVIPLSRAVVDEYDSLTPIT